MRVIKIFATCFVSGLAVGWVIFSPTLRPTAPMKHLTFNCDTDEECAALPPCKLKPGCDGGPDTEPYRLVGYDCDGYRVPIYRDEEDEFPHCKAIEPTFGR